MIPGSELIFVGAYDPWLIIVFTQDVTEARGGQNVSFAKWWNFDCLLLHSKFVAD